MKYVQLKTQSSSLEQYNQLKKPVKIKKYIVIGLLLFVHLPAITTAYALSMISQEKYFNVILGLLIPTRLTYMWLYFYTYGLFASLFCFFVNKKIELNRKEQ